MKKLITIRDFFINENEFPSTWYTNAKKILSNFKQGDKIEEVFLALLKIIDTLDWRGACYPASTVLYVLFREMGLNAKLCVGNVASLNGCITHSWVEVDGKIYDATIWKQNYSIFQSSPVIASKHIDTGENVALLYGVDWIPLEPRAYDFMDEPFEMFINCPVKSEYVSDEFTARDVLYSISFYLNIRLPGDYGSGIKKSALIEKYKNLKMTLIKNYSADARVIGDSLSMAEKFIIGEWKSALANRDDNFSYLYFCEDGVCTYENDTRNEVYKWYFKDDAIILTRTDDSKDDSVFAVFSEIKHEPEYRRVSISSFELGMFYAPAM